MQVPLQELTALGLSPLAIRCYAALDGGGSLSAREIAADIGCPATSLYRLLEALQTYGFVKSHKIAGYSNIHYRAVPVEDALDSFFAYQRQQVLPIIQKQRRRQEI